MKRIILIFFLLLFSVFLASDSLNLVEIQKKEKDRRKKLSKSKYVLTNDKLIEYSLKKSKTFVEADASILNLPEKVKKSVKKEEKKEKKGEIYWRGRLNSLNKSIEQIRKKIQETQTLLNKASSDFLIATIPSLQLQLRKSLDNLQRQLAELKANLKQKEKNKELFFREARREGALPGWLR